MNRSPSGSGIASVDDGAGIPICSSIAVDG
jgi:hypothetical protein